MIVVGLEARYDSEPKSALAAMYPPAGGLAVAAGQRTSAAARPRYRSYRELPVATRCRQSSSCELCGASRSAADIRKMRSLADSRPKLDWVIEGQRGGISAAAIDALIDEYRPDVAIATRRFFDRRGRRGVRRHTPSEQETRAVSRQ